MKKTNKVHPITAFRKANEARQAVVKKSLKKAQDVIETNDMMINKPGSTGGYKNTGKLLASLAGSMRPNIDVLREKSKLVNNVNIADKIPSSAGIRSVYEEPPINMLEQRPIMNALYGTPSRSSSPVKGVVAGEPVEYTYEQLKAMGIHKRGGAVKTKKRK